MLRIITDKHEELDLFPDTSFEIIFENPMLDAEGVPSGFSTQIGFPLSRRNLRVFGYIPAMALNPEVKKLPVSIVVGGIPLVSGTLVYDGAEDSAINYTFTVRPLGANLDRKIWERSIKPFSVEDISFSEFYNSARRSSKGFAFPVMIHSSETGSFGDDSAEIRMGGIKYQNHPFAKPELVNEYLKYPHPGYLKISPVVYVSKIMEGIEGLSVSSSLQEIYNALAIVGRYKKFSAHPRVEVSQHDLDKTMTDIADYLPDVSFSELLKAIASLFCAAVYIDGDKLKIIPINDILGSSEAVNIEDKLSFSLSLSDMERQSYKFSTANEDFSSEAKPANGYPEAVEISHDGLEDVLNAVRSHEYKAVSSLKTGDIYSGKYNGADFEPRVKYACDLVHHNVRPIENVVPGEDAGSFDNSCRLRIVKTIADNFWNEGVTAVRRAAPVYEPLAPGKERDSEIYVGVMYSFQLTDHGYFVPITKTDFMDLGRVSISPKKLWEKYHKVFAEWLASERRLVRAEVNMSPYDIACLRMFVPVYFFGSRWLFKKMSVTVKADCETLSCTGEFVSL